MNRRQLLLTLLVAIISGFLGGALSVWFLMPPSVLAQDEVPKVIEAQEFRVVDDEGRMRAKLGLGTLRNLGVGYPEETHLLIFDEEGEERLKLVESGGFSYIKASDFRVVDDEGRMRARLGFSDLGYREETRLLFFDKEGEDRIALVNTERGDLGSGKETRLSFFDEKGDARIELISQEGDRVGDFLYITIQESRTSARATLTEEGFTMHQRPGTLNGGIALSLSNEGIPSIQLLDQDGNLRAVLGTTELKNNRTGSTEIRAVSSLVLFDEEGNVVWKAP